MTLYYFHLQYIHVSYTRKAEPNLVSQFLSVRRTYFVRFSRKTVAPISIKLVKIVGRILVARLCLSVVGFKI